MDIRIISGTDRPNSNSLKIAKYVKPLFEDLGVSAEIVNLEDFPLSDVEGGKYGKVIPSVKKFLTPVINADALLFVIPEYNGSFPGILKLFVDYLPFPHAFEKMPISFIGESKGAFGGLRAVEQFQMVVNYRNALHFSENIYIAKVHKMFDENEGLKDDFQQKLLLNQIQNFVKFAEGVRQEEMEKL